MPGYSDQNDPVYRDAKFASGKPRYVWSGGRWQALNDTDPASNDGSLNTHVTATSEGTPDAETFFNGMGGAFNGLLDNLGLNPARIAPNAPGAVLDTTDANSDAQRLAPLLAQLRNQRASGDGAWQASLDKATQAAQAQASALGQSQAGVGAMSAARNIGNAQAGAAQREAGQREILGNEARNDATAQIGSLMAGTAAQDAGQAATETGVRQGVTEANRALIQQGQQTGNNLLSGITSAIGTAAGLSDGGQVPGKSKVFGDNESNDTVPAMLSPGEIVIPRSHAGTPEQAAAFVQALQAQRGVQHFDAGGQIPGAGTGIEHGSISDLFGNAPQAPTVDNGGLLNTRNYDANRAGVLQNANQYAAPEYAAPGDPRLSQFQQNAQKVTDQQVTNATDANLAAGMAAPTRGGPAAGDVLQHVVAGAQQTAGNAAESTLGTQNQSAKAFADAILAQRARDQSIALAKQQAAWRQTQMNAGITLQNQNMLRNLVGGAGQGFASAASIAGGSPDDTSRAGTDAGNDKSAIDNAFGGASDDDWAGGIGRAHGGVIDEDEERRAADFVRALQRKKAA